MAPRWILLLLALVLAASAQSPGFTISVDSDYVVNNGLIQTPVPRSLLSKTLEQQSVKDYGATGDGVTDDTSAFQAALDSAPGFLFIPVGCYMVSGLVIHKPLVLYGSGGGTYNNAGTVSVNCSVYSILRMKTNSTANALLEIDSVQGGVLRDFRIDGRQGNQLAASPVGLYLSNAGRSLLEHDGWILQDLFVTGAASHGVQVDSFHDNIFMLRVQSFANGGNGFVLNSADGVFTDCLAGQNTNNGVSSSSVANQFYKGWEIFTNRGRGMSLSAVRSVVFTGGIIEDNYFGGVSFTASSTDNIISSTVFQANCVSSGGASTGGDIQIIDNGSVNLTVSGCVFRYQSNARCQQNVYSVNATLGPNLFNNQFDDQSAAVQIANYSPYAYLHLDYVQTTYGVISPVVGCSVYTSLLGTGLSQTGSIDSPFTALASANAWVTSAAACNFTIGDANAVIYVGPGLWTETLTPAPNVIYQCAPGAFLQSVNIAACSVNCPSEYFFYGCTFSATQSWDLSSNIVNLVSSNFTAASTFNCNASQGVLNTLKSIWTVSLTTWECFITGAQNNYVFLQTNFYQSRPTTQYGFGFGISTSSIGTWQINADAGLTLVMAIRGSVWSSIVTSLGSGTTIQWKGQQIRTPFTASANQNFGAVTGIYTSAGSLSFNVTTAALASQTAVISTPASGGLYFNGFSSGIKTFIQSYSGTYITNGIPYILVDGVTGTSFTLRIINLHSTNALSGTLRIWWEVTFGN